MTREEWLIRAVETIDDVVFEGALDTTNHKFQIACGRCKGQRKTECIQPDDTNLEDFFPTTLSVNFTIKDPVEMLTVLTYECIHAFFNIKGCNKRFKMLAQKYHFEEPYKEVHASDYLTSVLKVVYDTLKNTYGDFPGQPVVFPKKEKKNTKKNTLEVFCPTCGYALKVSRKMYETFNQATPTCACGTKMVVDLGEDLEEDLEETP